MTTINSIRVSIHFDDPQTSEEIQAFLDDLLEHHELDFGYGWEPTHCGAPPTDQPS
jgi:hypothetical protein